MKDYFMQLSRREQIMVICGGVFLLVVVLIRFIMWPLYDNIQRLHEDIDSEAALIEWMEPRVARMPQSSSGTDVPTKSISQLERSLKQKNMKSYVKDLSVADNESVNIVLMAVPMPIFLNWYEAQQAIGWHLEQATLKPGLKSGTADITLMLKP